MHIGRTIQRKNSIHSRLAVSGQRIILISVVIFALVIPKILTDGNTNPRGSQLNNGQSLTGFKIALFIKDVIERE